MNCEICLNNIGESVVILPRRQPNGNYQTLACLDCSLTSDVYCKRHNRPFLGFEDETSACISCIEDTVHHYGTRIAGLFAGRVALAPKRMEIQNQLNRWYQLTHRLPGYPLEDLNPSLPIEQTSQALAVARLIVIRAQRMRITPMEVVNEVASIGPQIILPNFDSSIE